MPARVDVSTASPASYAPPAPSHTGDGTEARPSAEQPHKIGADGEAVRVLAFSGGLYDAAMQLGAVHALLVTYAKPPDVIAGISTGAINAVAAAEILQAGDELEDDHQRIEAKVSRFRQIFEAYRQSPEDVLAPLLPDIYQIDAEAALRPSNLPIYKAEERANRHRAAQSRAGLIKLTNDLLRLNISVGSIARVARACLGLVAARELPKRSTRCVAQAIEAVRLWRVLAGNLFALAPVGARLVRIALSPTARRLADWLRTSTALRLAVDVIPGLNASDRIGALADRVEGEPDHEASEQSFGADAGNVIFRGWLRRNLMRGVWWVFGLLVVGTLIVGIPGLALLIVVATITQLGMRALHYEAVTNAWSGLVSGLVHAGSAIDNAAPAWLHAVASLVGDVAVYLAGVVYPALTALAYGATAGHHWMDVHWKIDAPLHMIDPAHLFIPGYVALLVLIVAVAIGARKFVSPDAILRYYGILDAVFDPYSLQSWLIRLFDPAYYGRVRMDDVVERALATKRSHETPEPHTPKTLETYSARANPIHVDPMAADVATGRLTVLPSSTPVVDALLAATAMPPIFQARPIPARKKDENDPQSWFIDGSVVANEPTRALVTHLTPLVNESSTEVQIYSASSLPLSAAELGKEDGKTEYSGLVDSSRRAMTLQSFRDATLDRRMTDLVARALPSGRAAWTSPAEPNKKFIRASVHPIELDKASSLNTRLVSACSVLERRRMIAEAVADGCRSTIEVLLHQSLVGAGHHGVASCRKVVEERIGSDRMLPCSSATAGAGLAEVCQFCALRDRKSGDHVVQHPQSLRVPARRRNLPVWPMGSESAAQPHRRTPHPPPARGSTEILAQTNDRAGLLADRAWPVERRGLAGDSRPTVSLLFSGGVFRGVYLAGVINAINEVGAQPDLIAGSSVGSITAAMAARVFCEPGDTPQGRAERAGRIARVAATYLSVDRLVLTDRFGDFIRNFTLRASATRFSIRDLDTTFRAFDRASAATFNRETRRVLAGLERLLYVSPFEALELTQSSRNRRFDQVVALLGEYAQEWLERGAVGLEILGSEPLELLIRNHVLDGAAVNDVGREEEFIRRLDKHGLQFIATVTNLTRGRLETLHIPATSTNRGRRARLVEALLASSAFPAVFRPRWSWEIMPETNEVEQYIDGGVMDNLPLDAVTRFLNDAREMHRLAPRPHVGGAAVPHLLFAGSLEVERPQRLSEQATRYIAGRWVQAYRRAKELSYNNKIEGYAKTQHGLRDIWQSDATEERDRFEPLDLEVVAVKPQWLCQTFAFHPMLGFQRAEQARSIAHGCKSTLERLYRLKATNPQWIDGWGMTLRDTWHAVPDKAAGAAGKCWYRPSCECPFSAQALAKLEDPLPANMNREVRHIHEYCGQIQTHRRRNVNALLRPDEDQMVSLTETGGHAIGP